MNDPTDLLENTAESDEKNKPTAVKRTTDDEQSARDLSTVEEKAPAVAAIAVLPEKLSAQIDGSIHT